MSTFDDIRSEVQQEDPVTFFKMETIGRLMTARDRKGLSQRELSALSGIPQKTISRTENGKDMPTMQTLIQLASALDLEIKMVDKNRHQTDSRTLTPQ